MEPEGIIDNDLAAVSEMGFNHGWLVENDRLVLLDGIVNVTEAHSPWGPAVPHDGMAVVYGAAGREAVPPNYVTSISRDQIIL